MGEDVLFTEKDPLGNQISLSTERYTQHIIHDSGHTDIYPEDIRMAIVNPAIIYQSSTFPNRNVYFAKSCIAHPTLYTKVAAEVDTEMKSGNVVTAFPSKAVSGGIDTERGPLYVDFNNKL